MLLTWFALAFAMDVSSETVRSGSVRDRVVDDDAELVIFYVSEHHGNLDTCGCDNNPRGGLPRLAGYLDAVERLGPDVDSLLVHAGYWASDRIGTTVDLTPDALVQNQAMAIGFEMLAFDGVNLSFRDSPWLRTSDAPPAVVSANAHPSIPAVRYVQAAGRTVAIVGVGRPGTPLLQPDGFDWSDPVAAVSAGIEEWAEASDLVVLLAFETRQQTPDLAEIPGVDIVIEAGEFAGKDEPWADDDTVWVRSRDLGQSVGELRLWFDEDGLTAAHDRWVSLNDELPEVGVVRKHVKRTNRERVRVLSQAGLAE